MGENLQGLTPLADSSTVLHSRRHRQAFLDLTRSFPLESSDFWGFAVLIGVQMLFQLMLS